MLTWILYVIFVSVLLSCAALAAEHRAHLRRKTSRWYWMLAILASLLIPTIISSVSIQIPDIFSAKVSEKIVLKDATTSQLSQITWFADSYQQSSEYSNLDPIIKQTWILLSTLLLAGLLASGGHLLWRKRQWKNETLLKTPVLVTEDVGPAVVGLMSPKIVIPSWVLTSPQEQQRAIIAHEQSHLDAGDPLLLTIGLSLLVFMPWNLPLWWQLRRLRCAIEVDCDARVLRNGQSIASYGETLIAVGQRQSGYIGSVAGMSESKTFLEKRIKIMVTKPAKWWRITAIGFGIASLGLVAVAAQVSPPNANKSVSAQQEISLTSTQLEAYTGTYKLGDFGVMTISRKGNQLFSQLTGQPAVEIFPVSTTEFFLKVVNAQLTFELDEKGNATKLILHQNGANIPAPRIDNNRATQINEAVFDKVKNQTPTPGSETALRGLIAGLASGNPDYSAMSSDLADATRAQFRQLHEGTKSLGAIKSLKFRAVESQGWDLFDVVHENGNAEWRIRLSETGLIIGAYVFPKS